MPGVWDKEMRTGYTQDGTTARCEGMRMRQNGKRGYTRAALQDWRCRPA